jgi:hypothetical protein
MCRVSNVTFSRCDLDHTYSGVITIGGTRCLYKISSADSMEGTEDDITFIDPDKWRMGMLTDTLPFAEGSYVEAAAIDHVLYASGAVDGELSSSLWTYDTNVRKWARLEAPSINYMARDGDYIIAAHSGTAQCGLLSASGWTPLPAPPRATPPGSLRYYDAPGRPV